MSLADLASWGNFVGGVAVLVSLAYLAVQVRQAQVNQHTLIQQGRAARTVDAAFRLAEEQNAQILLRGNSGEEDMSVSEYLRYAQLFRALTLGVEDTFYQHRHRTLSTAAFESTMLATRAALSLPGFRAQWRASRHQYDPTFTRFIDRLLAETPVTRRGDPAARWKALAQEELAGPTGAG
ncbi:MAG TPA: hypothetical protein VGG29_02315 [Caulobacteraceae bacterium]|jgi:hypothetical protein